MPIGVVVSIDVSVSTATTSHGLSPQSGRSDTPRSYAHSEGIAQVSTDPAAAQTDEQGGVTTRGRATSLEKVPQSQGPNPRTDLILHPRSTRDAIAANLLCFILHLDYGSTITAEGRAGGSWKSPSAKLGSLCSEGQQMVQIHKLNKPNIRLPFIEERQPFTLLDHALVKPTGSSVYVKWPTNLLWKKTKTILRHGNPLTVTTTLKEIALRAL